MRPDAILIAGPTASGKSAHAMALAHEHNGAIINADSMQVYPVLDVLTARPSPDDMATLPHHLYAHAPLDEPYSVARWVADVRPVVRAVRDAGQVPVFVGGTGLYFKALEQGLAHVPEISESVRADVRRRLIEGGSEALHRQLALEDPEGAARLRPSDGQRIARALEVVLSTGEPLHQHQTRIVNPPVDLGPNVMRKLIMPPRDVLHKRINARCEHMLNQGALDEVASLLGLNLPRSSTVLKAIGMKQLEAFLEQKCSLEEALEQLKAATRQYAKRQCTWFRGQLVNDWHTITQI